MATQPLPGFDPTQQNLPPWMMAQPGQPAPPQPGIYGSPQDPTNPSYNPDMGVMNNIATSENAAVGGAGQINQEALSQLGYYSPLQQQAQTEEQAALTKLQQTPGYTAPEAAQINVDYGANKTAPGDLNKQFFTSGEQSGIAGDPNAPVQTMGAGTAAEGAQLNAYGANLGGNVAALRTNVGGELANYSTDLSGANTNLDTGLAGAQGKFSALDTAVNNPALGDLSQEKQMTNKDVQDMRTAAGTTVGNMYRSSEDQLRRAAAAAGNTDPLAIAAATSRLDAQSAAGMGDAELQAQIAAQQAQAQRAHEIETQRYGETANTAQMRAGAATTEEAAAQNAAALAGLTNVASANAIGQTGVKAAEDVGAAGINAANVYGTTAVNQATTAANQNYSAAALAEQEAANREALLATNRQATQGNVSATKYGQGVQTEQLTAGGAANVGQTRIAGESAYRTGVAQQQGLAQQGGETAVQQQQNAYGTRTSGLNQGGSNAVSDQGNNQRNSVVNQSATLLSAIGGKKGAIVTKPTKMMLAEDGKPEMVVPLMPDYEPRQRKEAA
jgi:hypothetical protein